jgi:hypothetical protein
MALLVIQPQANAPSVIPARIDNIHGHSLGTSTIQTAGDRMRTNVPLLLCMGLAAVASTQCREVARRDLSTDGIRGRILGTVTAPDGAAVPGAPVQARDEVLGTPFRTLSSASGEYALDQVPAGTYELSVAMPGFKFQRFRRSRIVVRPDEHLRIDVALTIGNLDTFADDPYTFLADIRAKSESLTGPVPRTAEGRPDLSGVWFGSDDLYPEDPALLPWAAAVVKERLQNELKDLPRGQCLPAGVLPTGPFFRKFVQTPGLVVILEENDVVGFRQVFLDGRRHPNEPNPTWRGHAVGRWDRDTLVVDVIGFNDASVMGIAPHTPQLRVTERYHRRDLGHMEVQVTADDPGALSKPWITTMVWNLTPDPDQELLEFVCGENIDNMHLDWRQPSAAR